MKRYMRKKLVSIRSTLHRRERGEKERVRKKEEKREGREKGTNNSSKTLYICWSAHSSSQSVKKFGSVHVFRHRRLGQ
jgi:hypothetical protein